MLGCFSAFSPGRWILWAWVQTQVRGPGLGQVGSLGRTHSSFYPFGKLWCYSKTATRHKFYLLWALKPLKSTEIKINLYTVNSQPVLTTVSGNQRHAKLIQDGHSQWKCWAENASLNCASSNEQLFSWGGEVNNCAVVGCCALLEVRTTKITSRCLSRPSWSLLPTN